MPKKKQLRFVLCVRNDDYFALLELRKIYQLVSDESAAARHSLRVIDESGDDYLHPESYFVAIEVPKAASTVFGQAS